MYEINELAIKNIGQWRRLQKNRHRPGTMVVVKNERNDGLPSLS